jgi:hypothetical protein
MSFPRLPLLLIPLALGLPLATGGCGAPVAVVGASYGADGVSVAKTGKTTTDHFTSMVTKKDCALWRVLRNRAICEERDPGAPDPYKVNYDDPFRQQSEGGVEYSPPSHAAANAPATSWDAAAYKPVPTEPEPPKTAVADSAPAATAPPSVEPPVVEPTVASPAPAPVKHKPKAKKVAKTTPPKKPSPDQVASSH